jgi:signal transduction histidine kinase
MRLLDLGKTSAFRLTLLFSAFMIGSVLLLCGLIYWQSSAFLTRKLDDGLRQEWQEFRQTPEEDRVQAVNTLLASDANHEWQVALFAPDRHQITGNVAKWPDDVVVDGKPHGRPIGLPGAGRPHHEVRILAMPLQDGGVFLIAHRADEVHEVREVITQALSYGLIGAVGLALLGGMVVSFASLRRIEAMHRAAAAIMTGDFQQRLPETGTQDDFDKLARIVNAMLTEIERLVGDIKSAGDNIAHDLRTPLTRLRTRLEGALRRSSDAESLRAAMEDAIADTDQILATFRALLRISEVEAGQRRAGFTEVDLVGLASSAADLFEPIASERGLTFEYKIEPAPQTKGDPDLLFEALANLLDNAIKFTPEGGAVTFSLQSAGSFVVEDTGPGLPAERRDQLFQRFTRGDKARHLPGNGLGLALVAAVARLHGADLKVEEADPGCRMILTLNMRRSG